MDLLKERLDKGHYLKEFLDRDRLEEIIQSGGTWFGQLMDTPQLIAWLVQFDYWLDYNNINIVD